MDNKIIVLLIAISSIILLSFIPSIPFTTGQFIFGATNTDVNTWDSGLLDGKVLVMDGNKIGFTDLNGGSGTSFDANCPVGEVLRQVDSNGDYVCVPAGAGSIDTNWQTSWSVFDANIKTQYGLNPTAGYLTFGTTANLGSDGNLFWNNTNKRLGVGTIAPNFPVEIINTAQTNLINPATSGFSITNTVEATASSRRFSGLYLKSSGWNSGVAEENGAMILFDPQINSNPTFYVRINRGGALSTVFSVDYSGYIQTPIRKSNYQPGAVANEGMYMPSGGSATSGAPIQYSPYIQLEGDGWDTNASASKQTPFRIQVTPVSGSSVTSYLDIFSGIGTTSPSTNIFRLSNTGNVGIGLTSPTAVLNLKAGTASASTAPLKFTSGSLLTTEEIGAIEFNTDKYYATITNGIFGGYISNFPIAYSMTYVKTINQYSTSYGYKAFDPSYPLIGTWTQSWLDVANTNRTLQVDFNTPKVIDRIYYENQHNAGVETNLGVKNFTLWGSNDANFLDTNYLNDTNWTQITGLSTSQFAQHVTGNTADPKYITISSAPNYRYYRFKIADGWGSTYFGIRHIELQTSAGVSARKEVALIDNYLIGLTSGRVPFATTNGRLMDVGNLLFDGNSMTLLSDVGKLKFGAGSDAEISYNGTDLNINPKSVGSGKVNVQGNLNVDSNYMVAGVNGLTKNMTVLKDADLIGLTKTYCDLNFVGGILIGSTC